MLIKNPAAITNDGKIFTVFETTALFAAVWSVSKTAGMTAACGLRIRFGHIRYIAKQFVNRKFMFVFLKFHKP